MATSLERVRLKIGDRSRIQRKQGIGDGVSKYYKMDHEPISNVTVWINDVEQTLTTNYTVDEDNGLITFITPPAANDVIVFQYYASVWTDADITDFLTQYDDNVNITAAHILLSWAADVAKIAKRETLSGGGGVGSVTRDTSVAARELRATAKALMDWEIEYGADLGTQIPADGITEIPWTESAFHEIEDQRFIREN